jgi:hypothetical protein
MPLSIAELKAQLAATKIKGRGGNFLRLDTDKPVVCHVLPGKDRLWFRQIGTHWLGKARVNCASPDGEGSCYICDMIKQLKEELAEARKEHEQDTPEEAAANEAVFAAVEKQIEDISSRRAFAFNVLIRSKAKGVDEDETPKTFESPWMIFNTIYTMFNSAVNDYEIDITDPHESTPFTFVRTGSGKNGTRYSASPGPRGVPLFSGPGAEAKIEAVLSKMLDLDEHYKYPEKTALATAWNTYTNGETAAAKPEMGNRSSVATPPPTNSAPPKFPPSMSRIGGKAVTPTKASAAPAVAPPETEPEETGGNGNGNGDGEETGEETSPSPLPTKTQAALASSKLLTRLKSTKK